MAQPSATGRAPNYNAPMGSYSLNGLPLIGETYHLIYQPSNKQLIKDYNAADDWAKWKCLNKINGKTVLKRVPDGLELVMDNRSSWFDITEYRFDRITSGGRRKTHTRKSKRGLTKRRR